MRAWAIIALVVASGGCQWRPAAEAPPTPCRVDLAQLVALHPRWPELAALDARIAHLRAATHSRLPAPRPAALPAALPLPPPPPAPDEREPPAALHRMELTGDALVAAQQEELAERHQARLEQERFQRQNLLEMETALQGSTAAERIYREQDAIVRRYQDQVTALRLKIGRLSVPSEIPDVREKQQEKLAAAKEELAELERRREAEAKAAVQRLEQEVARSLGTVREQGAREMDELQQSLERQRQAAARTARQDWEERMEIAAEALREAPPGAVAPAAAAPMTTGGSVSVTPEAAGDESSARQALAALTRQRQRLEQTLRQETRRRVEAIAAQRRLQPLYSGAGGEVPNRTHEFARELKQPYLALETNR